MSASQVSSTSRGITIRGQIAVIGPRLESAGAPCSDRDDRLLSNGPQRRDAVGPGGFGRQNHEARGARAITTGTPIRRSARARDTRSAGVGKRDVCGSLAMAVIPIRQAKRIETFPRAVTRLREKLLQKLVRWAASAHFGSNTMSRRTLFMATLKKILLVDDDDDLREALSEQLVMTEDFDVFEAGTGAGGMEKTKEGLFDLVILDVGLPDTDGRELARLMRKQGVKCPIMMLTGHDSDADTILGLDAGRQ
jgi:CheY-like chemotaxis protein